ncbi:hypothetical protein ACIA8O_38850 [Kitasatospora sp. NPDC051853]|uniref:hypothetical protein n=1 Tax=Kitasatospora sp. NPDC051853 TaxID=3364058 RepID=UPI0037ADEF59
MGPTALTIGGLGLAGGILITALIRWWRSGFPAPTLAALSGGLMLGTVSAMCSGGLLGFTADRVATVTNKIGEKAVGPGTEQALRTAAASGLTVGGSVATLFLTVIVVLGFKCCNPPLRVQIIWGGLAGCSLGLAAGVTGLANATLIPWLNWHGDQIIAALH